MLLYPVIAALGTGLVLQPLVLRALTARAILDLPNERSSHTVATPRGGGIAIAVAALVGLALHPPARMFTVPVVVFAAIGLAEDVRGVPIVRRFALQVAGGVGSALLVLPGWIDGPAVAVVVPVAALWVTSFVNAFNFMDGINGISATHAMLVGAVYAVLGVLYDLPALTVVAVVLIASAATFLPWNAGRARMFLGDVGAYALGGLLASAALYAVLRGVPVEAAFAPLALYLADTGWTLAKRFCRGGAWYHAHREHVYQRLTDGGWSHQAVTALTLAVSGLVAALAVTAVHSGPAWRAALGAAGLAVLAGYLSAPAWLVRRGRTIAAEDRRVHA